MKKFLLIAGLLFAGNSIFAQYDKLVEYKSDYEKSIFQNLSQASNLSLFLAIADDMDTAKEDQIKMVINSFKHELESRSFSKKNESKKLKLLFKMIHDSFFAKYQEVSTVDQIFKNKIYNCVSGTALFALILQDYKIPYHIKEAPTHVYAIAYPDNLNILLESTNPIKGYYSPNTYAMQKAVNSLLENKYVTSKEVQENGIEHVYNQFFFSEDNISLRQLAGLQYYNEAVSLWEKEEYDKGLNAALKSEMLYPSKRIDYIKYGLLSNILNGCQFTTLEDIKYLAVYAELHNADKNKFVNTCESLFAKNLLQESKTSFADSALGVLSEALIDRDLFKKAEEIYYQNYGIYYWRNSNFNQALVNAKKAYEINSNNTLTNSLIADVIIAKYSQATQNFNNIESELIEHERLFPFLKDNYSFQNLYFLSYSSMSFNSFRADDAENGFKYLEKVEALIDKFDNVFNFNENLYGLLYAEAGAHYYRMRNYKSAKEIIEKGLKLLPEHPELKIRLEIVLEEL